MNQLFGLQHRKRDFLCIGIVTIKRHIHEHSDSLLILKQHINTNNIRQIAHDKMAFTTPIQKNL